MSDFEDARKAYVAARKAAQLKRTELIRAREEANRLERDAALEAREANASSGRAATERLQRIAGARAALEARLARSREEYAELDATQRAAHARFAASADPTEALERHSDDTPLALFPLRLEARYKTIERNGAPHRFLWVRVFPDDILIDAFQPEISEAELKDATVYWTHVWRAGGDPTGRRAAWSALAKAHGPGRAKWLIDRVAPLDPRSEPVARPGDHILVIVPREPVPVAERAAIARFWEKVWATAGKERDAAFDELAAAVGEARARTVVAELAPVNLRDIAVQPGPGVTPVIAFLDLPDPAALPISRNAWRRGARAWLLPERLVLMGFRGNEEVFRRLGEPIPAELAVGPDPAAHPGEQIKAGGADLELPEALRWLVDFEDAVAKGMAFSVDLTAHDLAPELDRLIVLGIRVGSDANEGAAELAELIEHHQWSRKGFSLLPQGRPTNNTDEAHAGYTWWENPDESYAHFFETDPGDDPSHWQRRKDGKWLAGMLGIDPAVLRASPHYYGTDQAEARAMSTALWPATLGYYMEQMMTPVFAEDTVRATREFFGRYVLGRGVTPLVRVGRQPYGVLSATVWSRARWWEQGAYAEAARRLGLPEPAYLAALGDAIERAVTVWRELARNVARVGSPGEDPHQTLLDIVGLHPTSVEFYQRYAESFSQQYNTSSFSDPPVGEALMAVMVQYVQTGLATLADLGWQPGDDGARPEILEKIFLDAPNLLQGPLVDAELSESAPLRVTRGDGLNYIEWLQSAARASHDTLRRKEGFDGGVPDALLYLMLHHALDLGYVDAGLMLRREDLDIADTQYFAERREPEYIHVSAEQDTESRWAPLYRPEPVVTGDPDLRLGDYIPRVLETRNPYLNDQLAALDVLKGASTAALERAFVEHLDCLTYRLDAWRMGLQAVQLSHLREESAEGFGARGVLIGAFGWLENLAPKEENLRPVVLDPELAAIFADGRAPLLRDDGNYGHIHAPSLDQAVTAAILRNGYLANATPETPSLLAVDLGSERVRLAQQVSEGIRNGQPLGALLGYRLERDLHDEPDLYLDRLIYELRRRFPLAGNRNRRTAVDDLTRVTQVEARNVIDGAAFADHIAASGVETYPYGLDDLPPLDDFTGSGLPSAAEIGAIVDGYVARMRSIGDAVADLGVAEGVYQVVRGNYDRAAGALDALSKGAYPPVIEVAATPRSGKTLNHRIALHLAGGLSPSDPANTTPRAKCEPALARWLEGMLPDPAGVLARVTWLDTVSGTEMSATPSMTDLGLAPVDLLYLVGTGGERTMPGFDELLIDFAERTSSPRHDAVFALEYHPQGVAGVTLFQLAPLVRALRGLVLGARPLRPTDVSLQSEAGIAEDETIAPRADKVAAILADLQAAVPELEAFVATLDGAIGDGGSEEAPSEGGVDDETARDTARDEIDGWMADYAVIARNVRPFGLASTGLTAAIEGRRRPFTALRAALALVIERWEAKQTEHDAVLAEYAALPGTATDEERTALLVRAGRIVSTQVIAPLPPSVADLEAEVASLRAALDAELANLSALHGDMAKVGAALQAATAALPAIAAIDQSPLDLSSVRDSVLALARDLLQRATRLLDEMNRRIDAATEHLDEAAAEIGEKAHAAAAEAAKALLGDAFVLLPEFTLSAATLAEWDNAWTERADLLARVPRDTAAALPIDDWLHGIARVRERPRHLEMASLLADALGAPEQLGLDALQFPYRAGDSWLALKFPETRPNGDPFVLDEEKLLYSAHIAPGAEIDAARPEQTYCGLLLDEWVEVVPGDKETTGLAFHFDRPSSEAPQTILLATPPTYRGAWQWSDVVDTLHETLDFARLRGVEPTHIDTTGLATLVPALISAVTTYPITSMLNLAFNNGVHTALQDTSDQ